MESGYKGEGQMKYVGMSDISKGLTFERTAKETIEVLASVLELDSYTAHLGRDYIKLFSGKEVYCIELETLEVMLLDKSDKLARFVKLNASGLVKKQYLGFNRDNFKPRLCEISA